MPDDTTEARDEIMARPDGPGASRSATGAEQVVSAHSGDAPSRGVLPNDYNILRQARFGGEFKPKEGCCRVGVRYKIGRGYETRQCAKPAKVHRLIHSPTGIEDVGYCGTHDPVAVAARDKARRERERADAQLRAEHYAYESMKTHSWPAFHKALVAIAEGLPSPREHAADVLRRFDIAFRDSDESPKGGNANAAPSRSDDSAGRNGIAPASSAIRQLGFSGEEAK